jgi:hypothetical protein
MFRHDLHVDVGDAAGDSPRTLAAGLVEPGTLQQAHLPLPGLQGAASQPGGEHPYQQLGDASALQQGARWGQSWVWGPTI